MYFANGMNPDEIGDFEIVAHQGRLHAFYLTLPNHQQVGHLVSDDGLNWQPMPPAIFTGHPGDFDEDQIWTMGIFRRDKQWVMLYTANQKRGKVQVIGQAVSDDLVTWSKPKHNPVAAPDPRWYEMDLGGNYRADWRDPHITFHNGVYHAFLCARRNQGLKNHRGCAGYFTSTDGKHWEIQPPVYEPGNCWDYECPSVFEVNNRFYMVAIHGGHNRTTYRVAEKINGPYRRTRDDSITPQWNMSLRPCTLNNMPHLFHWNRGVRDWGHKAGSPFICLASPKHAWTNDAGELFVQSCDWSNQHAGQAQSWTASTDAVTPVGKWQWHDSALVGSQEPGTGHWLAKDVYEDFELSAVVTLDAQDPAREVGFLFRADDAGDECMYVRIVPGRSCVELVKQFYNRTQGPLSMRRGRDVMQTFHLPGSDTGRYEMRLIAYGPNIEFNVNKRLVISQLSMPRRNGRAGVFVEDGRATFKDMTIATLQAPRTHWD